MTTPERRYRRWLWAYPKEYRNVHGEEILSTLLDANSGGGRYAPLVPRILAITSATSLWGSFSSGSAYFSRHGVDSSTWPLWECSSS